MTDWLFPIFGNFYNKKAKETSVKGSTHSLLNPNISQNSCNLFLICDMICDQYFVNVLRYMSHGLREKKKKDEVLSCAFHFE